MQHDTKILALEKSKQTSKGATKQIIADNIAALEAEKLAIENLIASELKLKTIEETDVAVKPRRFFYGFGRGKITKGRIKVISFRKRSNNSFY